MKGRPSRTTDTWIRRLRQHTSWRGWAHSLPPLLLSPVSTGYLNRSRLLLYFDSERKTRNRQGRVRRLPCCPSLIHYSAEGREGAFPEARFPVFRVSGKPVHGDLGNATPPETGFWHRTFSGTLTTPVPLVPARTVVPLPRSVFLIPV